MSQTLQTSDIRIGESVAIRAPNAENYETGAAFETSVKGVEDEVSVS